MGERELAIEKLPLVRLEVLLQVVVVDEEEHDDLRVEVAGQVIVESELVYSGEPPGNPEVQHVVVIAELPLHDLVNRSVVVVPVTLDKESPSSAILVVPVPGRISGPFMPKLLVR